MHRKENNKKIYNIKNFLFIINKMKIEGRQILLPNENVHKIRDKEKITKKSHGEQFYGG